VSRSDAGCDFVVLFCKDGKMRETGKGRRDSLRWRKREAHTHTERDRERQRMKIESGRYRHIAFRQHRNQQKATEAWRRWGSVTKTNVSSFARIRKCSARLPLHRDRGPCSFVWSTKAQNTRSTKKATYCSLGGVIRRTPCR
jgi:hypothetical protein